MHYYYLFFLLWLGALNGQDCTLTISGQIIDTGTEEQLAFANIYVEEAQKGAVADENGQFSIEALCPGAYHLQFRHVGCEPERVFIQLIQDTVIQVELHHHAELIDEVIVHGSAADNTSQNSSSLNEAAILRKGDTNLGAMLDGLSGVSTIRNGAGISKPVVHGLFGNRVAILNNGIAQSGQQWGNDHAPEIDPFVADHLSVLKGVAALQYNGSSLGGVVLVEPGNIENEPHLHGQVNYLFASNGRGHTLNTRLEKASQLVNWRFTGTLKHAGDTQTPDYFLNNTGRREANAALQLEKEMSSKWSTSIYASHFATKLGVLRGSHIGNLTDLSQAVERSEPLFTEAHFSDFIESPSQAVEHSLFKFTSQHFLPSDQKLTFTYAGQLNQRREFDVRRGNDDNTRPALSLQQWNHFFSLDYNRPLGKFSILKTGLQTTLVTNTNDADTGILPLIPNYTSLKPAAFGMLTREKGKLFSELGIRYEFINLNVLTRTRDLAQDLIRYQPMFHNVSAASGLSFQHSASMKFSANLGYASRSPEVNELYSNGLHQGVSGIEEGDINLQPENALKGTLSVNWTAGDRFFFQALTYYQRINDYIYLQPQEEFRLTIRGAFPVFIYEQTDAEIAGLDLLFSYEPTHHLKLVTQYSYLRGQDLSNELPLVFMPPNRLSSGLEYAFQDGKKLSNTSVELKGEYTFKQNRLEAGQDLLAAPDAYFLFSAGLGTHLQLGSSSLHFNLRVDNLLNTRYRDFLNRLRYFADETGRNVVAGVSWEF